MKFFLTQIAETINVSPTEVGVPEVHAEDLIPGILNTAYWIGGVAAVIVIVIAGIFYAISQGDANRIKRAKEAIIYASVGLVVIMIAFTITNFIIGRFAA